MSYRRVRYDREEKRGWFEIIEINAAYQTVQSEEA